jgi:hypothetical protein
VKRSGVFSKFVKAETQLIIGFMRVYIDTSVIGGYFDEEFQEWTVQLFKEFEKGMKIPVVSDLTLQELENAPKHIVTFFESIKTERIILDVESIQLARNL